MIIDDNCLPTVTGIGQTEVADMQTPIQNFWTPAGIDRRACRSMKITWKCLRITKKTMIT